jgi:hypothetical protein
LRHSIGPKRSKGRKPDSVNALDKVAIPRLVSSGCLGVLREPPDECRVSPIRYPNDGAVYRFVALKVSSNRDQLGRDAPVRIQSLQFESQSRNAVELNVGAAKRARHGYLLLLPALGAGL